MSNSLNYRQCKGRVWVGMCHIFPSCISAAQLQLPGQTTMLHLYPFHFPNFITPWDPWHTSDYKGTYTKTCLHSTFTSRVHFIEIIHCTTELRMYPDDFARAQIHSTDNDWYCLCHIPSHPSWPSPVPSILFGKSGARLYPAENDSAKIKSFLLDQRTDPRHSRAR